MYITCAQWSAVYFDALHFHRIGEIWNNIMVWNQLSCNAIHNALLLQFILTHSSVFWCTQMYYDEAQCILMHCSSGEWVRFGVRSSAGSVASSHFILLYSPSAAYMKRSSLHVSCPPAYLSIFSNQGGHIVPPLNILGLGGVSWWGWSLVA